MKSLVKSYIFSNSDFKNKLNQIAVFVFTVAILSGLFFISFAKQQVKADFTENLTDVFTESFNEVKDADQPVNSCQDADLNPISNCVFLRSIKGGSVYFGDRNKNSYFQDSNRVQGRYDQANSILIPNNSGAVLKLNHKLEIEKGLDWDVAKILISEENNTQNNQTFDIKNIISRQNDKSYYLEDGSYFDISKFDGKKIKISFTFDTIDEKFNNFFGWEIYDFQILKSITPVSSSSSSSSNSTSSSSSLNNNSRSSSSQTSSSSTQTSSSSSSTTTSSSSLNSENTSSSQSSTQSSTSSQITTAKKLVWTATQHENFPNLKNLWRTETNLENTSLIYNSGSNYQNGLRNAGNITSNEINLPTKSATQNLVLTLNSDLNVETNPYFDIAKIVVIEKSTGGQTQIWQGKTSKSGQVSLDLNPFSGRTIYLKFQFDTIDSFNNKTSGWIISDLKINI